MSAMSIIKLAKSKDDLARGPPRRWNVILGFTGRCGQSYLQVGGRSAPLQLGRAWIEVQRPIVLVENRKTLSFVRVGKDKKPICVYCGKGSKNMTKDHVLPKLSLKEARMIQEISSWHVILATSPKLVQDGKKTGTIQVDLTSQKNHLVSGSLQCYSSASVRLSWLIRRRNLFKCRRGEICHWWVMLTAKHVSTITN